MLNQHSPLGQKGKCKVKPNKKGKIKVSEWLMQK